MVPRAGSALLSRLRARSASFSSDAALPSRLRARSASFSSDASASRSRVSLETVAAAVSALRSRGVPVVAAADGPDATREVTLKSRDFHWYSPVLKSSLRGLRGDAVVHARHEEDVVATAGVAAAMGVPLVPRGAGTGNYGQAVPLRGGIVLDLSLMRQIVALDPVDGVVRAGAGILLADLEDTARSHGWELRQHPSTRRTATLGGFVAGGSTGVGALMHGGLAEDGAVLGLRVVTAEPEPRVLELTGRDVFPVVHAYGTNGVITEVEVPLARAQPWWDCVASFPRLADAAKFALELGEAPAIVAREVSVHQAPTFATLLSHTPLGKRLGEIRVEGSERKSAESHADRHVVLAQVSGPGRGPLERLATDNGGAMCFAPSRSGGGAGESPGAFAPGSPPLHEYAWNHTTLHALKRDKSVTYLQAAMPPGEKGLAAVDAVAAAFDASEVLQHLEVVRFGGRVGFASLALLRPREDERGIAGNGSHDRLREIMRWHEANGVPVFDPHAYVLEDGGMKETDFAQLGFKKGADPAGVMNPGKMRAWEEGKATTEASDPRGSFSAAYRLARQKEERKEPTSGVPGGAEDEVEHPGDARETSDGSKSDALMSRYWSEWSTADFSRADLRSAVAILPLGAIEAHGPHLPVGVDAMHNDAILRRALDLVPDRVRVLALPALDFGASCEHAAFAGTVGLQPDTARRAWEDIGACVARAGIRKLILYNSHGGNHALAEDTARRLRIAHDAVVALALNLGCCPGDEHVTAAFPEDEIRFGIHGGAVETSVMMHLRPELVRASELRRFPSSAAEMPRGGMLQKHQLGFGVKTGWVSQDLHPAGVVGDAAAADAGKGAALADAAARGLARLIEEMYAVDADEWTGNEAMYPPQGGGGGG